MRTSPGATALKRTFCLAYVAAADRTKPMIPALAAAIASWLASPTRAAALDTSTTEPPSPFIRRPPARTHPKAEVRFVAIVAFQSAADVRCAGLRRIEPAQFAKPSSPPSSEVARSASASIASGSVASTVPHGMPSSVARVSSRVASRPARKTFPPEATKRRTSAEPIPPAAPITSTRLAIPRASDAVDTQSQSPTVCSSLASVAMPRIFSMARV